MKRAFCLFEAGFYVAKAIERQTCEDTQRKKHP